uniref:Protein TILB n=1 Tax=Lygus hesperus TaxID=30085 RepID=A0A146LCK8_LYGHE
MPRITEELIRKKSEHNEMQIGSLEEISLHQEDIEKLEYLQNWCKDLKILLLHNNLISKIENLGKLKKLEYINFSQNNIEKVENLERCESLTKLDFTLNFIGELTSIESLKNNMHLKDLYLTGNPCTDFDGYRAYVVATLPQLETLDGEEVIVSERIVAQQNYGEIRADIVRQQNDYQAFRKKQRAKNQWKVDKWMEEKIVCCKKPSDPEQMSEYWNQKSEHCPETRVDIALRKRLSRERPGRDTWGNEKTLKAPVKLFSSDGRPLNVNQPKIPFKLEECFEENCYKLDVAVYKHLDSALISADVQPSYVTVEIKKKILQLVLMEEVDPEASFAKRSQTTGHLLVTMPWVKQIFKRTRRAELPSPQKNRENKENDAMETRREYLEVGETFDLMKMLKIDETKRKLKEQKTLIDDPEVPPLM